MKKSGGKFGNFVKTKPALFVVCIIIIVCIVFFGSIKMLHHTSTSKFCGVCHQEAKMGPGAEYFTWQKNVHSYMKVNCIDCHGTPGIVGYMHAKMGGMKDLVNQIFLSKDHKMKILTQGSIDIDYAAKMIPNVTCEFCHSDEVNKKVRGSTAMSLLGIKMRNLDKVVNPEFREQNGLPDIYTGKILGVDPNHSMHVKTLNLSCLNCHQGVAHGNEFINSPKMQTCFACHDKERPKLTKKTNMPADDACATCHKLVEDVQAGKFLKDKGIPETPWMMPSNNGACESCHVDANTLPDRKTCIPCHNKDYADMFDSFRADFQDRQNKITPIYFDLYKHVDKMNKDQLKKFNEMKYFMTLINLDLSKGIHNTDLMGQVFDKAEALGKELKADLKL